MEEPQLRHGPEPRDGSSTSLSQGSPVTALTMAFAPHDSTPHPAAPHENDAAPTRQRARAYAKARRHSRYVRLAKVVIPAGALVATGLIVLVTAYNPFGRIGLTLGPMSISGTKVAMEGPRLTGFKKDARPYEVTASAAYQDIRKPNVIELREMKARMVLDQSGTAANLISKVGIFDTTKEHLELSEDIRITTDKGEQALLQSASIDFKTGSMVSKDPVQITMTSGKIDAAGMQISDNGKTIAFTGHVRVVLKNGAGGSRSEADHASPKLTQAEPAKP
jgi:lipopolysaccharide export system protein LptC